MGRGEVTIRITGDASHLKQTFGEAEGHVDSFGSRVESGVGKLATIGAAAVAAGGTIAAAFGVKAVTAASDLNETLSKVGVVFGPAAAQVEAFADQLAGAFGLPKRDILDAAAGLGLVGKASGLAQPEAAKMATQLAQLAADASSFYNVPLEEALGAIQSGLVGEAEPLRRFGVLLSEAAVKDEAVRLGLAKTGDELTEQQKVQARSSLILKGMTDASGDLERTQGSLANRLREAQGRVANFAAEIGQKLLPFVLEAFDLFERWAPIVKDGVAAAFDAARGPVVSFIEVARDTLLPILGKVAGFIKDNVTPILAALGVVLAGGLVVSIISAVTSISAFIAAAGGLGSAILAIVGGPITLIIAGVAALAAGVVYAYQNFEGFRNVVDGVLRFVAGQAQNLVAYFQRIWPQITEAVAHAMNAVEAVIRAALQVVQTLWNAVGDDLLNAAKTVWNGIAETIDNALQLIRGIIQTVVALINGDWGKAWDGLKDVVGAIWDQIGNIISTGFGLIRSLFGGFVSVMVQLGRTLLDGLWSGVQAAWDAGVGFFTSLPGALAGLFAGAAGWLVDVGMAVLQGLWDGITAVWDTLVGWLGSLGHLIGTVVGTVLNPSTLVGIGMSVLQGLWNGIVSVWDTLVGWLGNLGAWMGDTLGRVLNWDTLWGIGVNVFQGLWNGITWLWGQITSWLGNLGAWIGQIVGSVLNWNTLWGIGVNVLQGLWNGMRDIWNQIWNWIGSMGHWIGQAAGNALNADTLWGIGWAVIQGLWNGMTSLAGNLLDWARNFAGDLIGVLKNALSIFSPSRKTMELGEQLGEGLLVGMRNMEAAVMGGAERLALAAIPTTSFSASLVGSFPTSVAAAVPGAQHVTIAPTITVTAPAGADAEGIADAVDARMRELVMAIRSR